MRKTNKKPFRLHAERTKLYNKNLQNILNDMFPIGTELYLSKIEKFPYYLQDFGLWEMEAEHNQYNGKTHYIFKRVK